MLIKDLQGQIQQAYAADIQDKEVLHEHYVRRVLHLRKVSKRAYSHINYHIFNMANVTWLLQTWSPSAAKNLTFRDFSMFSETFHDIMGFI